MKNFSAFLFVTAVVALTGRGKDEMGEESVPSTKMLRNKSVAESVSGRVKSSIDVIEEKLKDRGIQVGYGDERSMLAKNRIEERLAEITRKIEELKGGKSNENQ